jgi:serine/threonine-protein kinase RsbT
VQAGAWTAAECTAARGARLSPARPAGSRPRGTSTRGDVGATDGASLTLRCLDPRDRFACAALVRRCAEDAGFDRAEARALALCAAELASNAVRHGGGGTLTATVLGGERRGLELTCRDAGPGVPDPAAAVVDGWSRGRALLPDDPRFGGLGTGLGAVRRMTDELVIATVPGGGALIRARKYL